jgi:hypothetical protein
MTPVRSAAALVFLCFGARLAAQSVEIQLREQGTNAPVSGAVVRLLHQDKELAQGLTNLSGRAVLTAPSAGLYRIRVNRIGFRSVTMDSIALAAGQTVTKVLTISSAPFTLPTVEVQTKSQCGTKLDDGATVAAVWEQIATALSANVVTQTQWRLPLNVQRFKRTVSLDDSVMRDLIVGSYVVHGPPFGAADPVMLEKNGFVTQDKDGTVFNAPDAQTVLSDAFVTTHCFRIVPGTNGLIGLAFEPVPKRELSDVKGTLWIDQASSELRSLEFAYTNLHDGMERVTLGGRMDFKRLETGAWIVSYWHIRMPKIHVIPGETHFLAGQKVERPEIRDVDYFIEEGGRVTVVDATVTVVTHATLIGTVVDSSAGGAGLAGAVVRLMGEPDSTVTDSTGRFRLVTRSAGTQTATVTHPKLGLIADSSTREVHLSLGSTTRTDFGVPTATRFVREFCGKTEADRAGIVGRALSAAGVGLEGYDIRVTWVVAGADAGGGKFLEEHAETGPNGIFVICSLPGHNLFTIRAQKGGRPLATAEQRLESGDYLWIDLKAAASPPG